MADLDTELSNRLSTLAAAVPVSTSRPDPVHRGAVAARQRVRMAWVTPLLFLVVVAVLGAGLRVGPFAPGATASPRFISTIREGDFELTIEASKATYASDENLDVTASLTYRGPEHEVTVQQAIVGPIVFEMFAPGVTLQPRGRLMCVDLVLERGVPIRVPLGDLAAGGARFSVTHGWHEISATAELYGDSCSAPKLDMETSVLVAVTNGPDDIPLMTAEEGSGACPANRLGGRLATTATGLGVDWGAGNLREVVWPWGYSARSTSDGAILLGRDGGVVAHEGDNVIFSGYAGSEGPIRPCGGVELEAEDEPTAPPGIEITLVTATVPTLPDGRASCRMALGGGVLSRNPRTGLGFEVGPEREAIDVVWQDGYTAWIEDGIATLRNPTGAVVAREGDHVSSGGGYSGGSRWFACGSIEVVAE